MRGMEERLQVSHLQLEHEGLPSAIVPWCDSPALRCEAAKNMLCTVSHHKYAWPHLGSPVTTLVAIEHGDQPVPVYCRYTKVQHSLWQDCKVCVLVI